MKQYLITEEELNKLGYIVKASNHPKIDLSDWLKSFKSQLASIKTLDRQEVLTLYDEFIDKLYENFKEEILEGYQSFKINQEYQIISDNFITAICNLALPEPVITSPITEDDIVEVLKECFITGHMIGFESKLRPIEWEETATDYQKLCKQNLLNQYIKEILGKGEEWEVVASGEATQAHEHYEDGALINGVNITELLGDYDEENIEIAVREVK